MGLAKKLTSLAGILPVKKKFGTVDKEEKETKEKVAEKVGKSIKRNT